jgi:putative DNA primase/helicase
MGTTSKPDPATAVVPILLSREPTDRELNYAKKSLQNAWFELRNCPVGSRNAKLNALGYSLGRQIARGWISRERVEDFLLRASADCGLLHDDGERQCRATLNSGLDAGVQRPYHDI